MTDAEATRSNGKDPLYAAPDLLDRQMVDRLGMKAGKVDDLELTFQPGDATPYVSAILAGPGALAPRLAPKLGRWIRSYRARLEPEARSSRVDFAFVSFVDTHIQLTITREELEVMRSEHWARERLIERIPGAS